MGGAQAARGACPASSFHAQYVITDKIGAGSFGQVYEVKPIKKAQCMAAKIADFRVSSKSTARKEAALLRRLGESPWVVTMVDCYTEPRFAYIVMEKCDMTILQALEHAPEVTEKTIHYVICEMRKALVAIHAVGIVHRDIKPDSFLCSRNWSVKLCDFGLGEFMPSFGGLRGTFGTAPFMSPEMLYSRRYGPKTDVWSLGVTAYALLFGQFPYQAATRNPKKIKAAIMAGSPAPSFLPRAGPSIGSGTISDAAVRSTQALLQRDPESRPSAESAGALQWFKLTPKETELLGSCSLRPTISSAKRGGVFAKADQTLTCTDMILSKLQTDLHGSLEGQECDRFARRVSNASTTTGSLSSQRTISTFWDSSISTATAGCCLPSSACRAWRVWWQKRRRSSSREEKFHESHIIFS